MTPIVLRRFSVRPEEAIGTSQDLLPGAGQIVWTSKGLLVYTAQARTNMELFDWDPMTRSTRVLLRGHARIVVGRPLPGPDDLEVSTIDRVAATRAKSPSVPDLAWPLKESYRFFGPFKNPKTGATLRTQNWVVHLGRLITRSPIGAPVYSWETIPDDWDNFEAAANGLTDGDSVAFAPSNWVAAENNGVSAAVQTVELNVTQPDASATAEVIVVKQQGNVRPLTTVVRPSPALSILGWSADGGTLYYASAGQHDTAIRSVRLDGTIRDVYRENAGLDVPGKFYAGHSQALSKDGRHAVLVRSTNVLPAELVSLDLTTGHVSTLDVPNNDFQNRTRSPVLWYHIDVPNGDSGGRLYLPTNNSRGVRYPLIITQYISRPGFNAAVGDELPILALRDAGIAVFAMHSREMNRISQTGDFRMELVRVQQPLQGMEWIYRKLVFDGLVDPERCGLAGLSYGAEIAMYALWKSSIFIALSSATGSWDPSFYLLGGQGYGNFLQRRGFPPPDEEALGPWRALSAALNARASLPPLLLQTADGEENETIPSWFRLRRAGAPVIWYEYPNEGHVKRSPANRWWVYRRNLDWFRFWLQDFEDSDDPSKAEQYAQWRVLRNIVRKNKEAIVAAPPRPGGP